MASMTTKQRNALSKDQFALPEERRFPIPDEAHARDALARVAATGNAREQRLVRAAVKRAFPKMTVTT